MIDVEGVLSHRFVATQDQSLTLLDPLFGQHYHSVHGAITESMHVYIHGGLAYLMEQGHKDLSVLEMGLGTGLNAWLTLKYSQQNFGPRISYHAIEKYPLSDEVISGLNYLQLTDSPNDTAAFRAMHLSAHATPIQPVPQFTFTRYLQAFEAFHTQQQFHLIYFDAFAPEVQPELWETQVFEKLFAITVSGGALLTYCAKGLVKRNLRAAGWQVEPLPGPPGKREITRAIKK